MQLTILADGGEGLLFYRSWAELDSFQYAGVKDIDTSVNSVAHEFNWLLNESVNSRRVVWLVHNYTILGWLLHLGDDYCAFLAMVLVEIGQLLEGVFADDVGVEDEERAVILAENLFCQLQGTSSAEGFGFDGEFDLDIVLLFVLRQDKWVSRDGPQH